jgi:hypothetical protein
MRRTHWIVLLAACALTLSLACATATAKPGPVSAGFMERFESHSKAPNADFISGRSAVYGSDLYLYSILYLARKLDTGITGIVTYIHKYALNDNDTLTHIGNVTIQQDVTRHWKNTYAYSYVSNPQRAVTGRIIGRTASNWFNIGSEFNSNPKGKTKKTRKAGLTYNSATDFANSQTLTSKLSYRSRLTKRTDWELTYQLIYGLKSDAARGLNREVYANQYFLNLDRKLTKNNKLQLTYLYVNNQYNGELGDDSVVRLSWVHTMKSK